MGGNDKGSKEEKRESFVDKQSRQKRKNTLIGLAVLAVIVAIVAYASWTFIERSSTNPLSGPPGAGRLGDEHEHAGILVLIHDDRFDFSLPPYQVKSPFIHFEGGDGNTVHRHASNVNLGFLFDTIKIGLTNECYVFPDRASDHTFCTDDKYSLKFYVNHQKVDGIRDYVLEEDDKILISYGNHSQTQVDDQLRMLDTQILLKK